MNSDIKCNSILSSTTSFSDDDDDLSIRNNIAEIKAFEEELHRTITNNNMVLVNYFNQQNNQVTYGGSISSHVMIYRDQEIADRNLFDDYFTENPRYSKAMFRVRYQMSRSLFLRIIEVAKGYDNYFQQQSDRLSRL